MAKFQRRKASASAVEPCWLTLLEDGVFIKETMDGQTIPRPTDAEIRAEWEARRDELLVEYVRDHPCARPWAFWKYDQVDAGFAKPLRTSAALTAWGGDRGPDYRQQDQYLQAHGLLSAAELKHIPPWSDDWRPPDPRFALRGMLTSQRGDARRCGDHERAAALQDQIDQITESLSQPDDQA